MAGRRDASAEAKPKRARLRMYQVGFGDCFLLSFEYGRPLADGRAERHILVDFGSSRSPRSGGHLAEVAELIRSHTGGKLDVLVNTHRHKDHLSGFGAKETGEAIEGLQPTLVVRPWTEVPEAGAEDRAAAEVGAASRRFLAGLGQAQALAGMLGEAVSATRGLRAETKRLALDQVANKPAIDRLDALAKRASASYLFHGSPSGIEEVVPGIGVQVLGPPTLEQSPEMATQRADDPEYWLAQRALIEQFRKTLGADLVEAAREEPAAVDPGPVRWIVERMRDQHVASLLRIVRTVDDALNNTSVILLIEAGDKRLLFPGDAQIENWNYALKAAPESDSILRRLREVDLYKVGHHGSRNATPHSLFNLWAGGDGGEPRPLAALMSTLAGVHGKSEATRVPRSTLVAALKQRASVFCSTDDFPPEEPFAEVSAPLRGGHPFVLESDR
jgi:hypothetical protein